MTLSSPTTPSTKVRFEVRVQAEPFQIGEEYEDFIANNTADGAMASFVGRVRDFNEDATVRSLTLEHYPGMTEKVIGRVIEEARERWPVSAVRVIHRHGTLHPGDNIVMVLTASAHRHAALESCAFLMDHLKTRATFWKKEKTHEGSHWIRHRDSDSDALERWQEEDTP